MGCCQGSPKTRAEETASMTSKEKEEFRKRAIKNINKLRKFYATFKSAMFDLLLPPNVEDVRPKKFLDFVDAVFEVIPYNDDNGIAFVSIYVFYGFPDLESSMLNTMETYYNLSTEQVMEDSRNVPKHILLCLVIGVLARRECPKLTHGVFDYLTSSLDKHSCDPQAILYAILALEKFSRSSKNNKKIHEYLIKFGENPINILSQWRSEQKDTMKRQVGFCAHFYLETDSLRSYESMKVSSDGSELRFDDMGFMTMRLRETSCSKGVWYYEVRLISNGLMQIGWASRKFAYLDQNAEELGVGDDSYSVGYDGYRRLLFFNGLHTEDLIKWDSGDILGCLLDLDKQRIIFHINGRRIAPFTDIFDCVKRGFYPAVSMSSYQHCVFNFGDTSFLYPPDFKVREFE